MIQLKKITFLLLCTTLAWTPIKSYAQSSDSEINERPLLGSAQLTPQTLGSEQGAELSIALSLPPGYRAYANQFRVQVKDGSRFKIGKFEILPLVEFYDDTTKKKKLGMLDRATLRAAIEAPRDLKNETNPFFVQISYQACTKSFCLFPTTLQVPVHFKIAQEATVELSQKFSLTQALQKPFENFLQEGHLLFSFFLIFIAGLLTSFTPCVFPMIPITLAVLGRHAHARGKLQNFVVSTAYVLGIALTYALLGVFAASTGALFGSAMSSPTVLGFVSFVFLLMSLSMFGAFELSLPPRMQNRLGAVHGKGYGGAFLAGAIAGLIASPCVGPVLVSILTHVAQTKDLWLGFSALFVFALGMGMLFLILGLFGNAAKLLPKSGPWMEGVKHFFGLLMLGTFYHYLDLVLPRRWYEVALGIGLIVLGSLKGAFDPMTKSAWSKIRKGLCQALILVGAFFLIVAIFELKTILTQNQDTQASVPQRSTENWQPYSDQSLNLASTRKRPVVIDFSADWCAACKELDEKTFSTAEFQKATEGFDLLRFDATQNSPTLEKLKKKYEIMGLPTLIFIDSSGTWRKDLTVTAFIPTEEMLTLLEKMKSSP